ncbi:MAG: PIN domain-containing protein [Candidatus Aenigmatarchaeota archaeon]
MHKFIEIEKFYLDSNIVLRYFKNVINKKKVPFIIKALTSNNNFKIFVSSWTLAEVFEIMQKEFKLDKSQISNIFKKFLEESKAEIIEEFHLNSSIAGLVKNFGLEAKDALHLSISKRKKLALLTCDKRLAEKGILSYKKIVVPEELILEYSDFLKVKK